MTLEQELIAIFASTPLARNRDILVGYYGWEDGRPHTLTEIGNRFSITRERVRQVCSKLTKRLKDPAATPAPTMDRALALIADRVPCSAAAIETELVAEGLTAVGMSLDALATGGKLLGRRIDFKTVKVDDGQDRQVRGKKKFPDAATTTGPCADARLAIRPEQFDPVLTVVDLAKKDAYFHGIAKAERIQSAVATLHGRDFGPQLVRQTLMLIDGFRWLDEESGWFRLLPMHKHGLPKAIDKVLAVAGTVTAAQLRTAIGRNRRLWKEPPPENVLLEFCREMPRVRIDGDQIISDPPRDWEESLIGVEAKLVATLLTHGPVMERGAMEDMCVAEGVNRFSFHAFVSWSPVIAQYGHSVYGLLGADVSQQQVDRLLTQRRASRLNHRVLDRHGRTEDGKIWLGYRLSKAASTYAVITVPAALKKLVRGRFELLAPDGRSIGTLATKDGRAWGLGAFLRQQGARINERIILTLDLEKRSAVVSWAERSGGAVG